jgi:hypothetical protein
MSGDALGLRRYLLDDQTARLAAGWIAQLAAGRDVPPYGSREWLRAPRDVQIAACLHAAEAHRRELLFAAQAVADELEARQHQADVAEQFEFERVAAGVRAMGTGSWADHAELQRRRAQPLRPVRQEPAA